jgi:hypothetical protein
MPKEESSANVECLIVRTTQTGGTSGVKVSDEAGEAALDYRPDAFGRNFEPLDQRLLI